MGGAGGEGRKIEVNFVKRLVEFDKDISCSINPTSSCKAAPALLPSCHLMRYNAYPSPLLCQVLGEVNFAKRLVKFDKDTSLDCQLNFIPQSSSSFP